MPRSRPVVEVQALRAVFHDQHGHPRRIQLRRRGGSEMLGGDDPRVEERAGRGGTSSRGPSSLSSGDVASEQLGQLPREGEAEPGPLELPLQRGSRPARTRSKIRSWSAGAMPMPVSATEKIDRRDRPPATVALTRISPRSVNLSALEMKLRRICEILASSEIHLRQRGRVVEHEAHRLRRPGAGAACRAARRRGSRSRTRPAARPSCPPPPWPGRGGRSPAPSGPGPPCARTRPASPARG